MKIALVSAFAALAASGLVDAQQAVGSGSCTQCVTGFTNEVPRAIWMGNQCNQYNPKKIDWLAFRDEIKSLLGQSGAIGPDRIPFRRLGAMFIRGAFHDAGSFRGGVGGADGSMVLAPSEAAFAGNMVPFAFVGYVRAGLWHLVDKYQVSWADAIAVAGAAATQFLGGTTGFKLRVGRCDNNVANPVDALPAPTLQCNTFESYWDSVGLTLTEGLALMGSHCLVDTTNRMANHQWSNSLYTDSLTGTMRIFNTGNAANPQTVSWSQGAWRYTPNDAWDAPQNAAAGCPFRATEFANMYNTFSNSRQTWDNEYAQAYQKMTEIGATWSSRATDIVV